MAVCVTLTPDGALVPTGEPASQCGGYVLVSGAEHAQASILIELFQWPEPEVAAGWFSGVFTLVLALNVLGYVVGTVVKSVSTERD
ncbi:hypothetical protein QEG26_004397 [Stenotrophomonas maltophilia]|nr:hypothetical protein [Stenotrophomonas maltophilia]